MKKILFIALALVTLFSCKEDDYPYNGYALFEKNGQLVFANKEAGSLEFDLETDLNSGQVIPAEGSEWCSGTVENKKLKVNLEANTGDKGREASVVIKVGLHLLNLRIYQFSSGVNHVEIKNPEGDKHWTATTSGEQTSDGGGVSEIFNDSQSSFWHSQYSPSLPLPHWIVVDLKEEMDINQVRLGWRKHGDKNYVSTKKTIIQVSTDGVTFTDTGGVIIRENTEGSLSSAKYTPYNDCPFTSVKARYVRLFITESNASNGTCNVAYFKVFKHQSTVE